MFWIIVLLDNPTITQFPGMGSLIQMKHFLVFNVVHDVMYTNKVLREEKQPHNITVPPPPPPLYLHSGYFILRWIMTVFDRGSFALLFLLFLSLFLYSPSSQPG